MKLSAFITSHREQILAAWEQTTRRRVLHGDQALNLDELRDHLGELLESMARDLDVAEGTGRPPGEPRERSANKDVDAVAEKHGASRAKQGMTVNQVVREFPILRSCVARLWLGSLPEANAADLETLICFDEAIDRALAKSVTEFMGRLDQSRETFLGILGHDLRDPLATIISGGKLVLEEDLDRTKERDVVGRIVATGERMHHLVVDLLDFTRTQLGGHMPIDRRDADLGDTVRAVAEEFITSHPDREVNLQVTGDAHGQWDVRRLSQAVGNLLGNALRHGAADTPIDVSVVAEDEVSIVVHNEGRPIPEERRAALFEAPGEARTRGAARRDSDAQLGLGLYIANAIATGHGGRIDVDSSADRGTTFTIHLPRKSGADEEPAAPE